MSDLPTTTEPENADIVLGYIDKTAKTNEPHDESELSMLVNRLQRHSHSSYCKPLKNLHVDLVFLNASLVKQDFFTIMKLHKIRVNFMKEHVLNHQTISMHIPNAVILHHWRANMDIQVITNAEGAAYDVCSYLCKSEPD